jgi:frataxin-like iron-binding protein CyaY
MVLLFGGSACSEVMSVTANEMDRHRALWVASGIVSYRYDYQRSCECGPETVRPVRIEVVGGSVATVTFRDDGQLMLNPQAGAFATIDDLFDMIDEAIRAQAESLVVTYDPTLGYPTLVSVDYRMEIADDEFTIRASNLEPF